MAIKDIVKSRQAEALKRYQREVAPLRSQVRALQKTISESNVFQQERLIEYRNRRLEAARKLSADYYEEFGGTLNDQALKFLVEQSKIDAPTLTSIMAGYELARASDAENRQKQLTRQIQDMEVQNKIAEARLQTFADRFKLETEEAIKPIQQQIADLEALAGIEREEAKKVFEERVRTEGKIAVEEARAAVEAKAKREAALTREEFFGPSTRAVAPGAQLTEEQIRQQEIGAMQQELAGREPAAAVVTEIETPEGRLREGVVVEEPAGEPTVEPAIAAGGAPIVPTITPTAAVTPEARGAAWEQAGEIFSRAWDVSRQVLAAGVEVIQPDGVGEEDSESVLRERAWEQTRGELEAAGIPITGATKGIHQQAWDEARQITEIGIGAIQAEEDSERVLREQAWGKTMQELGAVNIPITGDIYRQAWEQTKEELGAAGIPITDATQTVYQKAWEQTVEELEAADMPIVPEDSERVLRERAWEKTKEELGIETTEVITPEATLREEVVTTPEAVVSRETIEPTAQVIQKHAERLGIDPETAMANMDLFARITAEAESASGQFTRSEESTASGIYQIVEGTIDPALNRLERTTGTLPWMEGLRETRDVNQLGEEEQKALFAAQMLETSGTDELMRRALTGDTDAMKEAYYTFWHTPTPEKEEAILANWDRAFSVVT